MALPFGALCTAATAFISIRYVGDVNYGYVVLVSMLFLLIPFADFGLGAVVINAVADAESSNGAVRYDLRTVWRVTVRIFAISLVLTAVSFAIAAFGGWSFLLKIPTSLAYADSATAIALALFFAATTVGVGTRVLIGLGRVGEMTIIALLGPIISTITTWALIETESPAMLLSIAPAVGLLATNLVTAWRALGYLDCSLKDLRTAGPSATRGRLVHTAVSFLVMGTGVAIGLQSHRIILSHYSTATELSTYSLMAQMFLPLQSLTYTGSLALWSAYRQEGEDTRALWMSSLRTMTVLGAVLGAGFGLLSPFIARLLSSGEIRPTTLLAASFAALLLANAVHQASGYLLTDERGLRFQAYCVAVFAPLAVGLSIWLAGPLGATGPVLASVVAVGVTLLLPGIIRSRQVLAG